jgi:glycine/D-amino acid oxidase-like deaminating enzyme
LVSHMPAIVVIGGGVIGTSVAHYLACKGAKVTLLEKGDLASGSSGACDGLIFIQSKKPGVHLQLALASLELYEELYKELPGHIEFKKSGGMVIFETDAEFEAMCGYIQDQQATGIDVSLLNTNQALKKEPYLSKHIKGATFFPLDAQVNPIALTLGFALSAKQNGARIITRTIVKGIKIQNNRVSSVQTDQGDFNTDVIINAAGANASEIAAMVGINIPITPRRGQIVVTQAVKPILKHCLISAKYIAAKYHPALAKEKGEGISMEQTQNGNLLLGSTREFAGFNKQNTPEGITRIIEQTTRIIPELKKLHVIRTFAGLRPYTPDSLPILGQVDHPKGFVMAAGHEGDGIALAPITGKLIAQMILTGKTDIPLDAFAVDRFQLQKETT